MPSTSATTSDTTLDAASLDVRLNAQRPFDSPTPRIDLSDVTMITPGAMVQLAAVLHSLHARKTPCVIALPCHDVCSYLVRAEWIEAVRSVTTFEPPDSPAIRSPGPSRRGTSESLLEVTTLYSTVGLEQLLNKIVTSLQRLHFSRPDAFDVGTAISELCQNIFEHNRGTRGFLALQVYGNGEQRFVEIGVADHGDGLATTLRRNPEFAGVKTDEEAIRTAVKQGTSQFDDRTRGTGLFHLIDIVARHAGTVEIRSGTSRVRYRLDRRKAWAFRSPEIPGVHVAVTLNTKTG